MLIKACTRVKAEGISVTKIWLVRTSGNTLPRGDKTRASAPAPVTAGGLDASGLPRELTDPKSKLSQRSIYFDLDKYDVKDEFKDLVAAHAKYLVANKGFKVLIQGNTDERGSREYNLALGQRRADAVKQMLQLLGAQADQVESVSFGEEKPRCSDAAESCWSQNRRAVTVLNGAGS